jgi:hypothetical protein
MKRQNLRIYRVKEGTEIQKKGKGNLFYEITAENFPGLCSNIDIHVQEAF